MSELVCNNQRDFVLGALRGGLRIDGRTMQAMRQPVAHFGARTGQCEVALGKTRALAIATCDVVEPMPHRPNDGFLTFHAHLSPMADFAYSQLNRNSEEATSISRIIERTLKGSRAIDTEALCILSGKSVWSIRIEVTVLDNDGNVTDCCLLASLLALLHLRRPAITVDGDRVVVHSSEAREPVPLSIHHVPICISYALFDSGKLLVVDPTLEEEKCATGRVIIGMNIHNEICLLDYPGGLPISSRVFRQLPIAAFDKVKAITDFIEKSLMEDKERRKTEAMPVYARKFYDARKQQHENQAGPNALPQETAENNDALAGEDPFAGFLSRLVRGHTAAADTTTEMQDIEVDGMQMDAEVEESHVHDANEELNGVEEEADNANVTQPAADIVVEETTEVTETIQYETQPAEDGMVEVQEMQVLKKKKKKKKLVHHEDGVIGS